MDSEGVLRQVAVGRLMLDNFVNIKAYWVMSGLENAVKSQHMGANDFDGTVVQKLNAAGANLQLFVNTNQAPKHLFRVPLIPHNTTQMPR